MSGVKSSSQSGTVDHHHNIAIASLYDVDKELGRCVDSQQEVLCDLTRHLVLSGSFSVVKLVTSKASGKKYADKVISKVKVTVRELRFELTLDLAKGPGATEKGFVLSPTSR
jgi:hypothetical protein